MHVGFTSIISGEETKSSFLAFPWISWRFFGAPGAGVLCCGQALGLVPAFGFSGVTATGCSSHRCCGSRPYCLQRAREHAARFCPPGSPSVGPCCGCTSGAVCQEVLRCSEPGTPSRPHPLRQTPRSPSPLEGEKPSQQGRKPTGVARLGHGSDYVPSLCFYRGPVP